MTDSTTSSDSRLVYTATSEVSGGRSGQAFVGRDRLNVTLRPPQSRTEGADPEELFAAGYASCFLSALQSVARRDNITVGTPQARAHVSLHAEQGGSYHLSVQLQIHLPGTDDATAEALIHAAHATCPYSRAIAGNVQVDLELHSNPLL
ncbi:organic hydroperoxide resistance protein [Deinococcus seoulensis]|uniref:Organic hydroperoxide resistance protein n=1 Tax=Deinococcus seoulensis TaxID=1837379 RepID=A0ABQ2RQP8_9DEIO|nr:Ohr family peroxiredoxin [Deinococcus seoulensis]GGR56384.1 organic hydroperoxide resistance protein [Deinococcus seoulensis]